MKSAYLSPKIPRYDVETRVFAKLARHFRIVVFS